MTESEYKTLSRYFGQLEKARINLENVQNFQFVEEFRVAVYAAKEAKQILVKYHEDIIAEVEKCIDRTKVSGL